MTNCGIGLLLSTASLESQVEPPEVVDEDEADEQEDGGREDSVAVTAKLDLSLLLESKGTELLIAG